MSRRPFKNTRCDTLPPNRGALIGEAARPCTRKKEHDGEHHNVFWEWTERDQVLLPRRDRIEVPESEGVRGKAYQGAWRRGYVAALRDQRADGVTRCPYPDLRTDRGSITFSRGLQSVWKRGYKAGQETMV